MKHETRNNFLIHPGGCPHGTLTVPGDKSISHRAVMLAAIADGESRIRGFLESADCLATLAAFEAMGVPVRRDGEDLRIGGVGLHGLQAPGAALDAGNSGTSMRLLAGLLAAQAFDSELTGDASLRRRPMSRVIEPLRRMGADIRGSADDTAPLTIGGGRALHGIDHAMPVASAQVKSCLLLAGLYAGGETAVTEPAPCRDHTERMLEAFGVTLTRRDGRVALRGGQRLTARDIDVPGDLSSAAFFLVAAAIVPGSELRIESVGVNPTRAGVLDILRAMGADIAVENPREQGAEPVADLRVRGGGLRGIEIDPALVPLAIDEFPAIFVAAACAEGETLLRGAEELRVKESDRIAVMAEGLSALGIENEVLPDGIRIVGGPLSGGAVDSHGDHRVAMAFAVAAARAEGPVTVHDVANVDTSFPGFAEAAQAAGLNISRTPSSPSPGPLNPGPDSSRSPVPSPRPPPSSLGPRPSALGPVITLDGPSGSGKGTLSRALAAELGWHLLDSGALYRLVALAAGRESLSPDDPEDVARAAELAAGLEVEFRVVDGGAGERIMLAGEDVSRAIRDETVGGLASHFAAEPEIRRALLDLQRGFRRSPGLVADGRDMGTVVFPDAELKLFITASAEERARRRQAQLSASGASANIDRIYKEIVARDERDAARALSPLKPAPDAVVLDTTDEDVAETLDRVRAHMRDAGVE